MNPHTTFLIWMHYMCAWLVGFSAICGALFFGWQVLDFVRNPTPPIPAASTSPDGMVQVITGVGRGIAMVTRPIAVLGEAVMRGMFLASLAGIVFAAMLYVIGRGLSGGSGWARLLSGGAWGVFALAGALSLLSAGGPLRLAGASVLLLSGYVLWVLVTGFKLK